MATTFFNEFVVINLSSSNILVFLLSTSVTFSFLTIDIGMPGIPAPVPRSRICSFLSLRFSIIFAKYSE